MRPPPGAGEIPQVLCQPIESPDESGALAWRERDIDFGEQRHDAIAVGEEASSIDIAPALLGRQHEFGERVAERASVPARSEEPPQLLAEDLLVGDPLTAGRFEVGYCRCDETSLFAREPAGPLLDRRGERTLSPSDERTFVRLAVLLAQLLVILSEIREQLVDLLIREIGEPPGRSRHDLPEHVAPQILDVEPQEIDALATERSCGLP
jgi:hypothetical protein